MGLINCAPDPYNDGFSLVNSTHVAAHASKRVSVSLQQPLSVHLIVMIKSLYHSLYV